MSLLHEVTLERLWSKYENRYGSPPPITNAGFDEAISLIRKELTEAPGSMDAALADSAGGRAARVRPDNTKSARNNAF